MTTHPLTRAPHHGPPAITPAPGLSLAKGRVHEACGPARLTFALWLAKCCTGPVLWISPPHHGLRLNPNGLADFADPARFLLARPANTIDILWTAEEALRSGAAPLVVAELDVLPALTPVRRLHLAAESAPQAPLGLLLTPGTGGAQGIESRWHMAPRMNDLWTLERRRARMASPAAWDVQGLPHAPRLTSRPYEG